jgi:DNA repair photolyase
MKGGTYMKPIYKPKARAKEYGDLAINIYTGCPHRCYYCFAPLVLHTDREKFHSVVELRKGIVEAVKKQIDRENIHGKLIHLCFTCDAYPHRMDNSATREIIKIIKDTGNHVQILTKSIEAVRDFDLLDSEDWFGVTISCNTPMAVKTEPNTSNPFSRLLALQKAHDLGIKTWLSCEPVLEAEAIYKLITDYGDAYDKIKIGKLNYYPSNINWVEFGRECERLCIEYSRNYYIKDDLRLEMLKEVE